MVDGAGLVGSWEDFLSSLDSRMHELASQEGNPEFRLPVGLFLVLDEQNGGDATALELIRRLKLLDAESGNIVDFYYLGWQGGSLGPEKRKAQLSLDLSDFQSCRKALHRAGVRKFGGNADLILVDAEYRANDVLLRWDQAMILNLSKLVSENHIPSLGEFLQAIIVTSEAARRDVRDEGIVFQISDSLGVAFARESLLNFILEKWGKVIGAKSLRHLATKDLGPARSLREL